MEQKEVVTITDEAKIAIGGLLNQALLVEYGFILNYPRIIDRLVMYDKIEDEQLVADIERLGKESLRHFSDAVKLIEKLGGEPMWQLGIVERLDDVEKLLAQQLVREKKALELYQHAKLVATKNTKKIKAQDFFGRLIKMERELPQDVVDIDEITRLLEREIIDESRHIVIVKNSIATLDMLMSGRRGAESLPG